MILRILFVFVCPSFLMDKTATLAIQSYDLENSSLARQKEVTKVTPPEEWWAPWVTWLHEFIGSKESNEIVPEMPAGEGLADPSGALESNTQANVSFPVYISKRSEKTNFFEASTQCMLRNMVLLYLNNEEEELQLLKQLLNRRPDVPRDSYWMGGSKLVEDASGGDIEWVGDKRHHLEFKWFPSSRPFNYTNWKKGHPKPKRYCTKINYNRAVSGWKSEHCFKNLKFVCRGKPEDIPESADFISDESLTSSAESISNELKPVSNEINPQFIAADKDPLKEAGRTSTEEEPTLEEASEHYESKEATEILEETTSTENKFVSKETNITESPSSHGLMLIEEISVTERPTVSEELFVEGGSPSVVIEVETGEAYVTEQYPAFEEIPFVESMAENNGTGEKGELITSYLSKEEYGSQEILATAGLEEAATEENSAPEELLIMEVIAPAANTPLFSSSEKDHVSMPATVDISLKPKGMFQFQILHRHYSEVRLVYMHQDNK